MAVGSGGWSGSAKSKTVTENGNWMEVTLSA